MGGDGREGRRADPLVLGSPRSDRALRKGGPVTQRGENLAQASFPEMEEAKAALHGLEGIESEPTQAGRVYDGPRDPDALLGHLGYEGFRAGQREPVEAALAGRDFVIPDDVQHLVKPVLGHRLVLDLDRELRGATRQAVLDEVLAQTRVPLAESA